MSGFLLKEDLPRDMSCLRRTLLIKFSRQVVLENKLTWRVSNQVPLRAGFPSSNACCSEIVDDEAEDEV